MNIINLKVENIRRLKVVVKEGVFLEKTAEGSESCDSFIRDSSFLIEPVRFNSSQIPGVIEEKCWFDLNKILSKNYHEMIEFG